MSLFKSETIELIKQSKNKAIFKYSLIDDIEKYAEGTLYFRGEMFKFVSGHWGKGYAPQGKYKAYSDQLKHRSEDSFSQYGFGWILPLGAQFETDRSGICAHPDGGVKGTKGCTGLHFSSLDENVKCYNLFRDYFERANILNVEIV